MSDEMEPRSPGGMAPQRARIEPRWIRAGRAGAYPGMNRNRFDAEVRPHLTEIPIGQRNVAFDRLEFDA